jgi:hypothetical protein
MAMQGQQAVGAPDNGGNQEDASGKVASVGTPPRQPEHAQVQQAGSAATAATAAAAKPLVVLLDVQLDAPVLVLPQHSGSEEHVEVDLGTLTLSNRVAWEVQQDNSSMQRVLTDELQVMGWPSGCCREQPHQVPLAGRCNDAIIGRQYTSPL